MRMHRGCDCVVLESANGASLYRSVSPVRVPGNLPPTQTPIVCTCSVARPGQGAYIADLVYIESQPRGIGFEDPVPDV